MPTDQLSLSPSCRLLQIAAVASCLFAIGCGQDQSIQYVQRQEVVFRVGDEAYQPPEKHVEEIGVYLQRYFGTPVDPQMMQPTDQADDDGNVVLEERVDNDRLERGAVAYRRRCAGCHGVTGDGNGPAAAHLEPKPRDYRLGLFKFTSTPRGNKPTRSDLKRIIRRGAKGTSMPAFRWLPDDELNEIVDYVIALSCRGELELSLLKDSYLEMEPEDSYEDDFALGYLEDIYKSWEEAPRQVVMPISPEPLKTEETVLAGYRAFQTKGCSKCHGPDLQGGKELVLASGGEPTFDDWGNEDYAADITSRMLHGGRRPIDIYRRIYLGINGTPMPAFAGQTFADNPDGIWHTVHFVTEVIEGRDVADIAAKAGPIEDPAAEAVSPAEPEQQPDDPTDEPSPEEAPAEEPPADETPADDTPADDANPDSGDDSTDQPAEPADETPAEPNDPPAEPAEEASSPEPPAIESN